MKASIGVVLVVALCSGCATNGRVIVGPLTAAHNWATSEEKTFTLPSGEEVPAVVSSSSGITGGYIASLIGDLALGGYVAKEARDNNFLGLFGHKSDSGSAAPASPNLGDGNTVVQVSGNTGPVTINIEQGRTTTTSGFAGE